MCDCRACQDNPYFVDADGFYATLANADRKAEQIQHDPTRDKEIPSIAKTCMVVVLF